MSSPVTTAAGQGWAQSVVSDYDPDDLLKDALIVQTGSLAGTVEGDSPSVIVPYVAADPTATIVAEAGSISPDEGSYSQVTINTTKIAVVTRMSAELVYQPKAADRIAQSVRRAVVAKADSYFLTEDTTIKGLLKNTSITSAGTLGGAQGDLMAAYDAVAAIEAAGGQATHLLISPTDWAKLSKIPENATSYKSLLADANNGATRTLAGVPVLVHAAVTSGTALMLDRNEIIAAYGPLRLARSDQAYFTSDAVAIRATWRIGWNIVRPSRCKFLTVTEWTDGQ